ncbi:MAG: rhodanese-like domain-containing protein [bacterium]
MVVHCQSGYRSIIASSTLERLGFTNYSNLVGGFDAWEERACERAGSSGRVGVA